MSRCTCESDTGFVGPCHDGSEDGGFRVRVRTVAFETGAQYEARCRATADRLAAERDAKARAAVSK